MLYKWNCVQFRIYHDVMYLDFTQDIWVWRKEDFTQDIWILRKVHAFEPVDNIIEKAKDEGWCGTV